MIQPNAVIIVKRHYLPLDYAPVETYTWQGGNIVQVSRQFLQTPFEPKRGDTLWVGPYCVRVIDYSLMRDEIIAYRERPILSWLFVASYAVLTTLDLIYRRCIITLSVWGLADCRYGSLPSWRDVARRFQRVAE